MGGGGQQRSATATHRQATHLRRRRLMSSGEARAMGTDGCGAPSFLGVVGGVYRLSSCMPPRGVSTLFTLGDAAAGDGDCVAGGGCASVPPGSGPLDGQSLDGVSALISVAKPPGRNVTTDGVLCKAAVQSASLIRRGRTDAAQMHRQKCTGHKSPFRQKPPYTHNLPTPNPLTMSTFTSKYAMLKGKEGRELAKVRACAHTFTPAPRSSHPAPPCRHRITPSPSCSA